jgi:hypothetical protein
MSTAAAADPLVIALALWSLVALIAVALRRPAHPVAQAQMPS